MHSAIVQRRKPWQVLFASISALVIRDIQRKVILSVNTKRSLAFFWLFFEPIIHIGGWMMFRMIVKQSTVHSSLAPPVFILLGAVPFLFFRKIIGVSRNSIKAFKAYYVFRQIKVIDPLIALVMSELFVNAAILILILGCFAWFGIEWKIYHFTFWLFNSLFFISFVLGLGIIISIVSFFFKFISTFLTIFFRIIYFFSGIFYSAEMLTKPVRNIMLYNPIFQFIEITRYCFTPAWASKCYFSCSYFYQISICILLFSFALYISLRSKIMIEVEQR